MPRVQTFGQSRVSRTARPNVRLTGAASPEVFGAGSFANALQNLGGTLAQQAINTQAKANKIAALAADNQMAEWESKALYDEGGALSRQGRDALGLPEEMSAAFDERADEIAAGLNDSQRQQFELARQDRKARLDLNLRRHVHKQIEAVEAAEVSKGIENATNAAVNNFLDPARVGHELERAVGITAEFMADQGAGPEATEAAIADVQDRVHMGVLQRLIDENMEKEAAIYFQESREQIKGENRGKVQKALEESAVRGQSQKASDTIMNVAESDAEAREMVREIDDPRLRDETRTRVEARIAQRKDNERQEIEAATIEALNLIDANPRAGADAVPAALWASVPASTRASFLNYAKARAGGTLETDWGVYYNLFEMAADDQNAFKAVDLSQVRHQLDDTEFKQLVGLQLSMRTARETTTPNPLLDDGRTQLQVVNQALDAVGIDRSSSADDEVVQQVAEFRRLVAERVTTHQTQTGTKASNQVVQEIADGLLMEVASTETSFFQALPGIGRLFDPEPVTVLEALSEIPDDQEAQIREALETAGIPPTDTNVINVFREHGR